MNVIIDTWKQKSEKSSDYTKKNQTHKYREPTIDYQLGNRSGEGQYRSEALRAII